MGRIYKITNDINNKVYIGQTIKTLTKRWQQHKCNSTKEYFKQIVLYKAFKKYGIEHYNQVKNFSNSKTVGVRCCKWKKGKLLRLEI